MYTLHTINHKTGEEQIREFFTYNAALFEWEATRLQVEKYYDDFFNYRANSKFTQVGDDLTLLSNYQDIYLEKCEE